MTRLVYTFLVGVFLFVAGGTGGALAVTFKDGKVSKDNQVEEPAQKVERKSSGATFKDGKVINATAADKVKARNYYLGALDREICIDATFKKNGRRYWIDCVSCGYSGAPSVQIRALLEAERRGLSCEAIEAKSTQIASSADLIAETKPAQLDITAAKCALFPSTLSCRFFRKGDLELCESINGFKRGVETYDNYSGSLEEAKRRGLNCGVEESTSTQIATTTPSASKPSSAELKASQKEADRLRNELAAMKAQQAETSNKITSDTQAPLLTILSSSAKGKQGILEGQAKDNSGIAEVTVDGQQIAFDASGNFEFRTFIPATGKDVLVEVTDLAGLSNSKVVSLLRSGGLQSASISFDDLNPMGKKVSKNANALALIVGVDGYENTPARAIYADSDAQVFTDYASEKLGIPASRIKTLVNDGAGEREMLLSVKSWLSRSVKQDKTDVYIFFAGHGLASNDGQKMYLLPYDGAPELLEKTAILREELFSDISATNPRSVTVFLDTCYSGTTRGTDMLIASRPIGIRALEQSIPDNFTVMTAAAGDQTAKPLEEAKHGMFSYFLMKGMEGEADANNDNQITAGELHAYVEQNVVQQSSGSQTPELQGDASRVLVRFQ